MGYLEKMNASLDYIENNLTGDIDYDEAAKLACCSTYHFQKMFSFIVEVPLSEYIRRRRLTLAAFELQDSNIKVVDVALKYGYESPDAFTRAFQKLHGVTPTLARYLGVNLKAYPRISFHISIRGDEEMFYRIEQKPSYKVFGVSTYVEPDENLFEVLPKFGDEIWENGTHNKINDFLGKPHGTMLQGIHFGFEEAGGRSYMFGCEVPSNDIPQEYTTLDIPEATWAVFTKKGKMPDNSIIQDIWKRIYSEWFPTSSYEQKEGPCIEKYWWDDDAMEAYTCEVWVPVVKK